MVDDTYMDLMNREIDRMNTPEESGTLKEYLATNRKAQHLFDELMAMTNLLSTVKEMEPSPDLKTDIMSAIRSSQQATKKEEQYLKSLLRRLHFLFNYRYAYAFSFGLIVGLILYSLFVHMSNKGTSIDVMNLYGTLLPNDSSERFEEGDHLDIQLREVKGTVEVMYSERVVIAGIAIESRVGIEIILEFDEYDLNMSGFVQANNVRSHIDMDTTRLKVTHIGDNTYVIVFNNITDMVTPLNIQILSSGDEMYTQTISTGRSID